MSDAGGETVAGRKPTNSQTAEPYCREQRLDRLRGTAVLLMLVDHLLALAPLLTHADFFSAQSYSPAWWLRHTLTRLSMPLFMLVSGYLLYGHLPSRRRRVVVGVLGGCLSLLLNWTWPAFGLPEILVVWFLVMLLATAIREHPLELLVAGVLQSLYLPVSWAGYQPGLVAAFLAAGVLWHRTVRHTPLLLERLGDRLPAWLATVGRRSLWWYSTHLVLLALVARFTT